MIIYAQDGDYLFVNTETDTPFFPTLTNATITNSSGSKVSTENLAVGDIVTVTGDGAMTMSYPALYPGITKIKITSRGNMDEVAQYEEMNAMIFPPIDENEIPTGWVNYDTSLGNITLALNAYDAQGFATATISPTELYSNGSYANESGLVSEQIPDAHFQGTAEATVGFVSDFQSVTVDRVPLAQPITDRIAVELTAPQESVEATIIGDGELSLTIEAGYVYVINVNFANGEAHYAFITLES